jgi:hypothetical protein
METAGMFESIKNRLREARGARIKEEFEDVMQRAELFREAEAERFARSLDDLLTRWTQENGAVEDSNEKARLAAANAAMQEARSEVQKDPPRSFACAIFSHHLESSTLPGEDAKAVFKLTSIIFRKARVVIERHKA